MSDTTMSFTARCWRDRQNGAVRMQVMRVDTAGEVQLNDSTFLIRVTAGAATRCWIRHVSSGREVYVQSGPELSAFVDVCLLGNASGSGPYDEQGADTHQ